MFKPDVWVRIQNGKYDGCKGRIIALAGHLTKGDHTFPMWELEVSKRGNYHYPCLTENHLELLSDDYNMYGTLKSDVGADFCDNCERENPRHYSSCPKYGEAF